MIGLVIGETQLGNLIIKKLKFLQIKFVIIDISKQKIFKQEKNSFSLSIGQLGKGISLLKKYKCKKIIFAGRVKAPDFRKTRFDFGALYYLPKIIKASKEGDTFIIKTIIKIFSKEGFQVISSTFFNPELLLKKGSCTKIKPNVANKRDALKGKRIITNTKGKNIGQAVIVINGNVIAIEDRYGTDQMLNRSKNLINKLSFQKKRQGILLKFPKKGQDLRVDLPTIGINTVKNCEKIGLKGIVVKANQNIFLDRLECINLANRKKMFICAI